MEKPLEVLKVMHYCGNAHALPPHLEVIRQITKLSRSDDKVTRMFCSCSMDTFVAGRMGSAPANGRSEGRMGYWSGEMGEA